MFLAAISLGHVLVKVDLALKLSILILQLFDFGFNFVLSPLGRHPEGGLLSRDLLRGEFGLLPQILGGFSGVSRSMLICISVRV